MSARTTTDSITSFPHTIGFGTLENFGKNYQARAKTQMDFDTGSGVAFFTSITDDTRQAPGFQTKSFAQLTKETIYKITVTGYTIQGEARLFASNMKTGFTILDRIDIKLPQVSSGECTTVAFATTGEEAVNAAVGVAMANPSLGDEFALDKIVIEKMKGSVNGMWRTIASDVGMQTSVYNPLNGQWDEAMVLERDLNEAINTGGYQPPIQWPFNVIP